MTKQFRTRAQIVALIRQTASKVQGCENLIGVDVHRLHDDPNCNWSASIAHSGLSDHCKIAVNTIVGDLQMVVEMSD